MWSRDLLWAVSVLQITLHDTEKRCDDEQYILYSSYSSKNPHQWGQINMYIRTTGAHMAHCVQ